MISYARVDHHDREWSTFLPALFGEIEPLSRTWLDITIWFHVGWFRGPHVLVAFSSAAGLSDSRRTAATAALLRAITSRPSAHSVDERQWLDLSQHLAREDLVVGPYGPLQLDNRVSWMTGEQARVYLDPRVEQTMGELLALGLSDDIRMLESSLEDRNDWAFTGMAVLADEYRGGGLERGYLSYLSHWKEFLCWQPASERIEEAWSMSYESQRDDLGCRLALILDRNPTDTRSAMWRAWAEPAITEAEALARSGSIGVSNSNWLAERAAAIDPSSVGRWQFGRQRPYSDFHIEFRKLDTTLFELEHEFAAYRFIENAQFRRFSSAGVNPLQRGALAYLLSRTVEDHLQTTWREIVRVGLDRQNAAVAVGSTVPSEVE